MSGVDRAALIEAAADALQEQEIDSHGEASWWDLATGALDAVLPLVAQAIEENARGNAEESGFGRGARRRSRALRHAARLVRSLAEEGQQQ